MAERLRTQAVAQKKGQADHPVGSVKPDSTRSLDAGPRLERNEGGGVSIVVMQASQPFENRSSMKFALFLRRVSQYGVA